VVIDANIGVGLFVPLVYSLRIRELWDEGQVGPSVIVVPTLWHYEVLSSIRKAVVTGLLNSTDAPA
jgi:predicted nucleic acid-binding protein